MRWIRVEDTTWPVDVDGTTQDALRYKGDGWTALRLAAASVMSAYAYLTDPTLTQTDAIASLKRARKAAALVRDKGEDE